MSAPLQTSSAKLDIASSAQSMLTSPASGVGEDVVATPFATLFAAVQVSEAAPEKTTVTVEKPKGEIEASAEGIIVEGVVEEDLNGKSIVGFEQTNSVLAPRQNFKAALNLVEDEDFSVEAWPDFAAIPAWSVLPEEVVLAAPAAVSLGEAPIVPEEQVLLIEPVDPEAGVDFAEQFAPKFVAAEGDPVIAVTDALPNEDPFLQTVVTNIEPVNTAGPIKLSVAPAAQDLVGSVSTTILPVVSDVVTPVENLIVQPEQANPVKTQPIIAASQNIDNVAAPVLMATSLADVQMPIVSNAVEGPYGLVPLELDPTLAPQNLIVGMAGETVGPVTPVMQVISSDVGPVVLPPVVGSTATETQVLPKQSENAVLDDAVLASPVVHVGEAEVSLEEIALPNGQLLGNKGASNGIQGGQSIPDVTDIEQELAIDTEVEVKAEAPVAKLLPDATRTTASVHPVAAMAAIAPKRVTEKETDSLNVEILTDEAVSLDGASDGAVTRPAMQTLQNSVVASAAAARTTPAAREAATQRATAQSNSEQLVSEEDLKADLNLSLSQSSAPSSAPSNTTGQAAPTAIATSSGTAAILDVRRQGWTKTLVNRAASMAKAGGSMTLSILPQNLGQITLKLSDGRKGLELRMTAEVASTTAMLRDVQGQIESAFDQAGLKLGSYSAQTGGQGQQGGSNQSGSQEDGEIEPLEQNTPPETDRIDHEDPDRLNILL